MATGTRSDALTNLASGRRGAAFSAWTAVVSDALVVHVAGDLDLAGRHVATDSCLQDGQLLVRVDMTELTFMDADGYGGLVAARNLIERCGGSMTFVHASGQPRSFLAANAPGRSAI